MHLQALKDSGLVRARRDGTFIHYRLAGEDVAALFAQLRTVATAHLADAERAAEDYLGTPLVDTDAVERDELLRRARAGDVVVLDVRPTVEYAAGHIPGAVSVPLEELEQRLGRPARRRRDRRLLPRRVLRAGLRRRRPAHRVRAARSTPARGHARVAPGRAPGRQRRRLTSRTLTPHPSPNRDPEESMSTLFILNDPPYGTELVYNGLRLAGNMLRMDEGHDLTVFLMGDAASAAKSGQITPNGYYNVNKMLGNVIRRGGKVLVCGTCMDARGLTQDDLIEGATRSTLDELTGITLAADKILTF